MANPPDLVLYDDACGMCRSMAARLAAGDPGGKRLRAVGRSTEEGKAALGNRDPATLPDSVLVLTADGRLLDRSRAVARVLRRRGGFSRIGGVLLSCLPLSWADGLYDAVARRRNRNGAACPVPRR